VTPGSLVKLIVGVIMWSDPVDLGATVRPKSMCVLRVGEHGLVIGGDRVVTYVKVLVGLHVGWVHCGALKRIA